jgi:hypothetical protein
MTWMLIFLLCWIARLENKLGNHQAELERLWDEQISLGEELLTKQDEL